MDRKSRETTARNAIVALQELGASQVEIARAIDKTPSLIRQYIAGSTVPTEHTLSELVAFLRARASRLASALTALACINPYAQPVGPEAEARRVLYEATAPAVRLLADMYDRSAQVRVDAALVEAEMRDCRVEIPDDNVGWGDPVERRKRADDAAPDQRSENGRS